MPHYCIQLLQTVEYSCNKRKSYVSSLSFYSKTGFTQGDYLSMKVCALTVFQIIPNLNIGFEFDRHMCYTDGFGAGSTLKNLKKSFDLLRWVHPPNTCISTTKTYRSDE